jgi:hypothetical protein
MFLLYCPWAQLLPQMDTSVVFHKDAVLRAKINGIIYSLDYNLIDVSKS